MKKMLLAVLAFGFLSACATDPYTGETKVAKTAWGAGIGTAVGAGVGALVGGEKGALIGAGLGAASGAATGGYMDLQARQLRQELKGTGVQIARDGENIRLIMPNAITFKTNEAIIKSSANAVLDSVSKVAKKYDQTTIRVLGYTDSTGNDTINIPLSQKRASAVVQYLQLRGLPSARLSAFGMGAQNPIASNASAAGREQNRRVEIYLIGRSE